MTDHPPPTPADTSTSPGDEALPPGLSAAEARALASGVLARATIAEGTDTEIIARMDDGIREITAIAFRTSDVVDRMSVLRMNAPLRLLAGPPSSPTPTGPVLGLAGWHGTLYYDEEYITAPLREMFASPGVRREPATLRHYRYALSELMSQNSHLLGASYTQSIDAYADPAVRLLELGVVEAWTARHLDEYIADLEVEPVAPGISSVQIPVTYPAYVPAVEELASGIAARIDKPADEILRRLNNVTASEKLPLIASLITGGEPSDAMITALRAPLFVMATYDTGTTPEPAIQAASAAAGREAVTAAFTTHPQP